MLSCSDPKTTRSSIALGVEKKIQKNKKKKVAISGRNRTWLWLHSNGIVTHCNSNELVFHNDGEGKKKGARRISSRRNESKSHHVSVWRKKYCGVEVHGGNVGSSERLAKERIRKRGQTSHLKRATKMPEGSSSSQRLRKGMGKLSIV